MPQNRNRTVAANSALVHEVPPKHRHPLMRRILLAVVLAAAACLGILGYEYATLVIPQPDAFAVAQASTVYYSDGTTPIGKLASDNRHIIDCSTLPDYVGNAIVASENRTFWTDSGIDLRGIARALFTNVTTGSRQGGSTITQQYAERYYLGETTTYPGKVKEALLALKIAQTQSKSTVLCNYMNTIYFGRGAYGIEEAALRYFGVSASQLTIPQAALLAGIIPAPNSWDPAVDATRAQQRFNRVISIMRDDGYLTQAEADAATMPDTINYTSTDSSDFTGSNGYLLMMVEDELKSTDAFKDADIANGGYTIITTIDKDKQALMQQVASPATNGLGEPDGIETGGMSADPRTGAIIAIYAGDDYQAKQLNNATQAHYEPGSTMKAFSLIGAIENGVSVDSTYFNGNSPQTFAGLEKPVANYANKSYGNVTLTQATAYSVNTVFMRITEKLGPASVAQIAHDAGISSTLSDDSPFVTLGIDGVTVEDVTQAYATIANQGTKVSLHCVASVKDSSGVMMYAAPTNGTQVFDANTANLATQALRGPMQFGTARAAGASVGRTMAGKTGTANDNTAESIVGYTPSVVTTFAIWYPGTDGSAQTLPSWNGYSYGEGFPNVLYAKYMKQALAGTAAESFPQPTSTGIAGGSDGTWGTAGGM